jgi:hypothetical protein
MGWPKSTGKSVEAYVAAELSRLNRVTFERDIKEYVAPSLASKLRSTDFQVLFEISDDYVRRYTAVSGMKQSNGFLKDCKSCVDLITATIKWLEDFHQDLNAKALNERKPVTALLARSISEKVSELGRILEDEFEWTELRERSSKSMLRMLSLKYLRTSYVAHLNFYIENVALRGVAKNKKGASTETLIAGVMSAAGIFSAAQKAEGLQQCVHIARWRAKAFLKNEFYDRDEFPVFQTQPRKKKNDL